MENKTAVMWLIDTYFGGTDNITANFKKHIEKALELEKQQIINAANIPKEQRWYDGSKYDSCGEKYYSETYNKPT